MDQRCRLGERSGSHLRPGTRWRIPLHRRQLRFCWRSGEIEHRTSVPCDLQLRRRRMECSDRWKAFSPSPCSARGCMWAANSSSPTA
jgi:hypothetical protein